MMLKCLLCEELYDAVDVGTCKFCVDEACESQEELKREIEQLKSKVNYFLSLLPSFTDVLLIAVDQDSGKPLPDSVPIPANKGILANQSPVFKAMLEIEEEEIPSGTIKVRDVSYASLYAFVNYLYTAEACLDDKMACDLLVLAQRYKVKHVKTYCEEFLISKLNCETSLTSYHFARLHNAENLLQAALSLILDNMEKLNKRKEYMEFVQKYPQLLVEIYEAHLSKQVSNAAAAEPSQ